MCQELYRCSSENSNTSGTEWSLVQPNWNSNPSSDFTGCVPLNKSLNLSVPHPVICKMGE